MAPTLVVEHLAPGLRVGMTARCGEQHRAAVMGELNRRATLGTRYWHDMVRVADLRITAFNASQARKAAAMRASKAA